MDNPTMQVVNNNQQRSGGKGEDDSVPSVWSSPASRRRRDDAHAIIKHVTATLLDVRPELGSSMTLTELTATAVESLVFGHLYEDIFNEIVKETSATDMALRTKIESFQYHQKAPPMMEYRNGTYVSQDALSALRMLPESHTPTDKLRYCVEFLERLASHCSTTESNGGGGGAAIGADSLLKLVCQHILLVVPDDFLGVGSMNAEIVFLEEFARDEQLLRGREGYALVTLQASLHFLNMSGDLEKDIFDQNDHEDNVPVVSTSSSSSSSAENKNNSNDDPIGIDGGIAAEK